MRRLIVLILVSLLLTGAVQQSYSQSIERSGVSEIERVTDIGLFTAFLPPGSIGAMADVCNAGVMRCELDEDDMVLTMYDTFDADNAYYDFEVEQGIIYSTYTLTLKRIPTDRFSELTEDLLVKAEVAERSGTSGAAIVLGNTETRSMAREMKALGMEIAYTVEMPGEITDARSGEIEGTMAGSVAEFDLLEVMLGEGPVVVQSRELNLPYLILIAVAITLGALALSFFWEKKGKKKEKKGKKKK